MLLVIVFSGLSSKEERKVKVKEGHVLLGFLGSIDANEMDSTNIRNRYTDFLVNEITPDGVVAHLTDDKIPKAAKVITTFVLE
jgi:hypothetical protein